MNIEKKVLLWNLVAIPFLLLIVFIMLLG